jgi:hypothetical protein
MVVHLLLGDIVKITAPSNKEIHDHSFFISYIDMSFKIELIEVSSLEIHTLLLSKRGNIIDKSIHQITLLNRSTHRGYARQNGLLPHTWVELHFGGEIPTIVTAKITKLEEDMIEMESYPGKKILFLDFAYKGIPLNIPLTQICIRNQPPSYHEVNEEDEEDEMEIEGDEMSTEYDENGQLVILLPKIVRLEDDYRKTLDKHTDQRTDKRTDKGIQEEDEFMAASLFQSNRRFPLEIQLNDLLDDFVSRIPDDKRSKRVMKRIYIHLYRFQELRQQYSTYDKYKQINGFIKRKDPRLFKPLAQALVQANVRMPWVLPVILITKKKYDSKIPEEEEKEDSIENVFLVHDLTKENEMIQSYSTSRQTRVGNNYESMYQEIQSFMTPFTSSSYSPYLQEITVREDTESLVKYDIKNPFITQRINKEITYPPFDRETNARDLMVADKVFVDSIVCLPEFVITNSSLVYSKAVSILQKTTFQAPYLYELLPNIQTKYKKEEESEEMAKGHCINYKLPHMINEANNYEKLLNRTVPNLYALIKSIEKNPFLYSALECVKRLEPYLIYPEHIPFTAFKMMKRQVENNIKEEANRLLKKLRAFTDLKLNNDRIDARSKNVPFLDTYFSTAEQNAKNELEFKYKLAGEGLSKIMTKDNGRILSLEILKTRAYLITLNMDPWIEPQRFVSSKQKVIAKKYKSLGDLQKDNNDSTLKFDSDLDVIDYSIWSTFKKKRAKENLSSAKMEELFAESLAQEYGCSRTNTEQMAKILMQQHQVVQDGDYAKLELKPSLPRNVEECELTANEKRQIEIEADTRKINRYYVRLNHTWVYDRSIEDDRAFAKPKNVFCKLNPVEKEEMIQHLGETQDDMEKNIQLEIDKYSKILDQSFSIEQTKRLAHDYFHSKLGTSQMTNVKVQSPYLLVLQKILHTTSDFVDKQTNIVSFYDRFCREPIPNVEDPNWKYCQQTSTKVLQKSLYDLAIAFLQGNYNSVLEKICKTNGKKSDDGNCIVDKYGGNVLCFLDFSEEGYEWMNIVEEEEEEEFIEVFEKKKIAFQDPDLKRMDKWITEISKEMRIEVSEISEPAMVWCIELKKLYLRPKAYENNLRNKNAEKKKTEEQIKKEVNSYVTKMLIDFVICSVVFTVQTSQITTTRKTKSKFSGFPLGPQTDKSTLYFMLDVCKQLNGFPFLEKDFVTRIMYLCNKMITDNAVISKLLEEKRLTNVVPTIPEHLNLAHQWIHFYPPTVPVQITSHLNVVSKGQHEEFKIQMKKGNPIQWHLFGVNQVNIMRHSFGVLETINDIVEKQDAILKTQLLKPFLENACCSEEKGPKNPWLYFVQKEPILQTYFEIVSKTGLLLYKLSSQVKAPFLHLKSSVDLIPPSLAQPNVLCAYSEVLQYTVMIRYCHLDSEIYPIPAYLSNVVREKHPEYNAKGSIEEKIAFFKENNQSLSFSKFTNMMSLIQNKNKIQNSATILVEKDLLCFNNWKAVLSSHPQYRFIQPSLLALFTKHMEARENNLDEIENAIQKQIDAYKKSAEDWFLESNIPKSRISNMFKDITKLSMNEEIPVSTLGAFVKNYLYLLCMLKANLSFKPSIPDHWGLLPLDQVALLNELEKTTSYRRFPDKLISKMKPILEPFYHFISHYLTIFPLNKKKLWNRFFTFAIFYVLNSYILLSNEPDVLEIDELSQYDDQIEPVEIQNYDLEVTNTIFSYLTDIFKNEQKSLVLYQDILKNVTRENELEKSKMKKHFEHLGTLERKTEVLIKKFRLEQFHIDPKTLQKYGNKRDKMIHDTVGEIQEEIREDDEEKDKEDDDEKDDDEDSVPDFLNDEDEENDEYDMAEYER